METYTDELSARRACRRLNANVDRDVDNWDHSCIVEGPDAEAGEFTVMTVQDAVDAGFFFMACYPFTHPLKYRNGKWVETSFMGKTDNTKQLVF